MHSGHIACIGIADTWRPGLNRLQNAQPCPQGPIIRRMGPAIENVASKHWNFKFCQ
jgi:hypothetical protein